MDERALRRLVKICWVVGIVLFLAATPATAQTRLQMSLGGVTGSLYMTGAPLAKFVNDHTKSLVITPNTSGGSVENIRRVDGGVAQLGMTTPEAMWQSWHAEKPFDKPLRNWRVVGVCSFVQSHHVVTLAQNNIKTVSDLKGKIFAIGAPGSSAAVGMNLFLEHVGLKGMIQARMLPHQDYPEMLLDGKIHAFNRQGAVPVAVVDEISVQKKVSLVDFGPEIERSGFLKKYPYYQKLVVKGGTYKGEERDITMFGSAAFLIANKDVPEAVIYEFTRLSYSDAAIKFVEMAFKGQNLNRKDPFAGNIGPVHPGAAKFWKEVGVAVPESVLR